MIKQEWVDQEIALINKERSKKCRLDENLSYFKIMLLLMAVFFCTNGVSEEYKYTIEDSSYYTDVCYSKRQHIFWLRCCNCGRYQLQVSKKPDYGDYCCAKCGQVTQWVEGR